MGERIRDGLDGEWRLFFEVEQNIMISDKIAEEKFGEIFKDMSILVKLLGLDRVT